jgi:hypothetical protein
MKKKIPQNSESEKVINIPCLSYEVIHNQTVLQMKQVKPRPSVTAGVA